jgi:hypothetical protein
MSVARKGSSRRMSDSRWGPGSSDRNKDIVGSQYDDVLGDLMVHVHFGVQG